MKYYKRKTTKRIEGQEKMVKRNIAIAILICVIIAIFAVAIIMIVPHNKTGNKEKNESVQPVMKISDVIDEAVYMGAYSTDTEIFADEQFAAKDILRTALAKSSGIPENMPVMIESYNYDNLSVFFDDGRTMRTLEQSGMANVMIVASIPKPNGDVYYAYNVQISVNESRTPKNTSVPDVTGSDLNFVTKKTTVSTIPSWMWNNDYEDVTTAVTKKSTWTKTTTAALKPSVTKPAVTDGVTVPATDAVSVPDVTEPPVQNEPEPEVPSADPQPETPAEPEPPSEPDPPAEPEPEPPVDPAPEVPADPAPEAPADAA